MSALSDLDIRPNLANGENPVARLPLGVIDVDTQLIVDINITGDDGSRGCGDGGNGDRRVVGAMDWQEVCLLGSQILHLGRDFSNLREEVRRRAYVNRASFGRLLRIMTRLAARPVLPLFRSVPVTEEEEGAQMDVGPPHESSEDLPRSLAGVHVMWSRPKSGKILHSGGA